MGEFRLNLFTPSLRDSVGVSLPELQVEKEKLLQLGNCGAFDHAHWQMYHEWKSASQCSFIHSLIGNINYL